MFLNIFWKKEIPANNYIRETKYERIQKFMKETYILRPILGGREGIWQWV
jgi:hypothetical protein